MNKIKTQDLCGYSRNQGCGSKIRRVYLKRIINSFPDTIKQFKDKIISYYDTFDDAAIYDLDENNYLIFTVDFITPVTNDPEKFGEIAVKRGFMSKIDLESLLMMQIPNNPA